MRRDPRPAHPVRRSAPNPKRLGRFASRAWFAAWLGLILWCVAGLALFLGLGGSSRSLADGGPSCARYEDLAASRPVTSSESPYVARALRIWRRVYSVYRRYQYRPAYLVVVRDRSLDPKAEALPMDVLTCPYPPDIDPAAIPLDGVPIYVSHVTLKRIFEDPRLDQPENLLALIFGHELGHRVNDVCPDGRIPQPILGRCQDGGVAFARTPEFRQASGITDPHLAREAWADRRGAFYAVQAGFAVRRLANDNALRYLLAHHFDYGQDLAERRQQSLRRILEHFDRFEDLYKLAVAATSLREWEVALKLLDWHAMLVAGGHEARSAFELPELMLLRAQVLYARALPEAPWPDRLRLGVPGDALRCIPVTLTHTGLHPVSSRFRTAVRGTKGRSRRWLERAANVIHRAVERGADRLVAENLRACVAAALGNLGTALDAIERARDLGNQRRLPGVVASTLARNAAWIRFLWIIAKQYPYPLASAKRADWREGVLEVAAKAGLLERAPELHQFVDAIVAGEPASPTQASLSCAEEMPSPLGSNSSAAPQLRFDATSCPAGWIQRVRLPIGGARGRPDASGVVVCARTTTEGELWRARIRWRHGERSAERTLRLLWPGEGFQTLDAWGCSLEDAGAGLDLVTLTGERVFFVRGPRALRAFALGKGDRVVQLAEAE